MHTTRTTSSTVRNTKPQPAILLAIISYEQCAYLKRKRNLFGGTYRRQKDGKPIRYAKTRPQTDTQGHFARTRCIHTVLEYELVQQIATLVVLASSTNNDVEE